MSTVETNDGVAVSVSGDLVMGLWKKPARFHRTRWFFDKVDETASKHPGGVLILLLILPTSSPPDAPARAENSARLHRLGPAVRRVVTVPAGDALFFGVVRIVMHAMFLFRGRSDVQMVESSPLRGIRRLLEVANESTPSLLEVERDVKALYAALGEHDDPTQAPKTPV
jgi:hypothetical protein